MKTRTIALLLACTICMSLQMRAQGLQLLLSVTDGDTTAELQYGLDPSATDGIDDALGEREQPPPPPTGAFDARFIGTDIGMALGQGLVLDVRAGSETSSRVSVHELRFQLGEGTSITIGWTLPEYVIAQLQDIVTGSLINVRMTGTGSTVIADPGVYSKLRLTVHYRPVEVLARAILQGPFNTWTGAMAKTLNTGGYLAARFGAGNVPADAVDSIAVEIRNAATTAASTVRKVQPSWLLVDGSIRGWGDIAHAGVLFDSVPSGSYYIVIRHRSHLAVMSAGPLMLGASGSMYDFTTGLAQYHGGDAKEVSTGVFALWVGDVTGNGIVKYNGSGNDRSPILTRIGGSDMTLSLSGYYNEDVNMNGQVKYLGTGNDRSIILQTIGGSDMTLTRSTNVPN